MAEDLSKIIDEIQSKLDIVQIVSSYIPLKKAGANYRACCPFHHEKTPSFMVSAPKQIYHCFGCGAGGDMISFVMKFERLEFMDALKILADKAGVIISSSRASGGLRCAPSFTNTLYRVNELAANYFSALLVGSSKAQAARRYLASRSVNAATVSKFKIGYAPQEWDGFIKFANEKGINTPTLEKAGLAIAGKDNSHFDRFRNRVMFPIFDIRSKIIAFGGRIFQDNAPENAPKYMNSPETDAYIKGRHLYGLNFALEEIKQKDYVIIVEGYFDLIIPYQAGIKNIVATLGTALTVEQIRLIKRFTNNAVILFDADEAGEAASLRGLDLLISEGLFVKIARLAKGFDPDTYVRKNSAEGFLKIIESADNLFDYKLKLLLNRYNPAEAEDKSKITMEMLPTIKRVENAVLRSDYLKKLSQVLFIKEEALSEEIAKVKLDYSYLGENKVFKERAAIRPAEKIIIGLVVEDPQIAQEVRQALTIEDFQSDDIRSVIEAAYALLDKGSHPTPAKIINYLNNDNLSHIICEALAETENFIDREKSLKDCIAKIKKDRVYIKREKLTNLIKEAEVRGDNKKVMELVKELSSLKSAGV